MKIYLVAIALSIVAIISCNTGQSKKITLPKKECIALNDRGSKYLTDYNHGDSSKILDSAIMLFKQALSCDSTVTAAYLNLANAYDMKHSYAEEMGVINKLLRISKKSPVMLIEKGMLYERQGYPDSAKAVYNQVTSAVKASLIKYPEDIEAMRTMINLKAIRGSKSDGLKTIDSLEKAHPNLSGVMQEERSFLNQFDRNSYVLRKSNPIIKPY